MKHGTESEKRWDDADAATLIGWSTGDDPGDGWMG